MDDQKDVQLSPRLIFRALCSCISFVRQSSHFKGAQQHALLTFADPTTACGNVPSHRRYLLRLAFKSRQVQRSDRFKKFSGAFTRHFRPPSRPSDGRSGVDSRRLWCKSDMVNPSNQPSTALIQHHNLIINALRLPSRDSWLTKQSRRGPYRNGLLINLGPRRRHCPLLARLRSHE